MKTFPSAVRALAPGFRSACLSCLLAGIAFSTRAQDASAPATNNPVAATNNPIADKAWRETYRAIQEPMPPQAWSEKAPTAQEVMDFYAAFAVKAADKAKDFYTRFPDHPKAEAARKKEYDLISMAVTRFGNTNVTDRLADLQKLRLADANLTAGDRFTLRLQVVQALAAKLPAGLDDFLNQARGLQKTYPSSNEVYGLFLEAAARTDSDGAQAILQEIVNGPASDEVKAQARGQLKRLTALGKPVDIQYTALDGRQVDLSKLKGKVVLIDFWATWCGPCVGEVPNVKAAYDKLHNQGFEILGISFDQSKDALAKFVKDKDMAWPQYFDGAGWGNKFGQEFGINSIPTMWLVDRQGVLRDVNAREGLAQKAAALLAK